MLTTKYLLLIIFYTKFQIPLFFKKKIKFFLFFYEKVLTLSFTFGIVSFVAREKIKNPGEMRYAEVSELADEQD